MSRRVGRVHRDGHCPRCGRVLALVRAGHTTDPGHARKPYAIPRHNAPEGGRCPGSFVRVGPESYCDEHAAPPTVYPCCTRVEYLHSPLGGDHPKSWRPAVVTREPYRLAAGTRWFVVVRPDGESAGYVVSIDDAGRSEYLRDPQETP